MIQGEAKCSLKICVSILSWEKKRSRKAAAWVVSCPCVTMFQLSKAPPYHIKLPSEIKLQFVSVFRNALKKSIRLPLYNKIHSAHVGGPKKKKITEKKETYC